MLTSVQSAEHDSNNLPEIGTDGLRWGRESLRVEVGAAWCFLTDAE